MRSRPEVKVTYQPRRPRAGDTVHFEVTVTARTETPLNNIRCRFRSWEERSSGTVIVGKMAVPATARHEHFEFVEQTGSDVLKAGESRTLRFDVALPTDLPPSHWSPQGSIEHDLEVRADIPWWPDRTVRRPIRIRTAPRSLTGTPRLFSTAPDGPHGTELVLQLALENDTAPLGGALQGAISVINAGENQVTGLRLRLRALETLVDSNLDTPSQLYASEPIVLGDGPPASGQTLPFRVVLPEGIAPSFRAKFTQVSHVLDVVAVRSMAFNTVLTAPIQVHEPGDGLQAVAPVHHIPLGNELRGLVWEAVATRSALQWDSAACTLSGKEGPIVYSIGLELSEGKLMTVATLEWPDTRLGLELRERRWSDVLKKSLTINVPHFDQRFVLQARELTQVMSFLDHEQRERVFPFDQVAMDDDGAELASVGNANSVEDLLPFVEEVQRAVKALGKVVEHVPAPPGLEPQRATWSAFAAAHGGTFCAGDFSIRDASYRGHKVDLRAQFDPDGFHNCSVAMVRLASKVNPEALSAEAQRVRASLSVEISGVIVGEQLVAAPYSSTELEPSKVENLWRQLQRLARVIDAGPT